MRLLIVFLCISCASLAQVGTGQWRLHTPARKATDVATVNGKIYTSFATAVTEYDLASNETTVWDAVNGLSDINVTCVEKSTAANAVFIGYENGNLDKLSGNSVTNIPAVALAEVQGSKRINNIIEFDDFLYLATGFAIVKIDPIKNEVRDTYYPTNGNKAIVDVTIINDTIWALTEDEVYRGILSNVALPDPNEWSLDSRVPINTTDHYRQLLRIDNELYIFRDSDTNGQDSVFRVGAIGLEATIAETFDIKSISNVNEQLTVNFFGTTIIYSDSYTSEEIYAGYGFGGANVNNVIDRNGVKWFADAEYGLVQYGGGAIQSIVFNGPPREDFFAMDWENGKLVVVSGGVSDNIPSFNAEGVYIFEEEQWQLHDQYNTAMWSGRPIYNYLCAAINPRNTDQIAIGTYSPMAVSLFDESGTIVDTFTTANSGLEGIQVNPETGLITDLEYDNSGNLWILNGGTSNPLKAYTADGEWLTFNLGSLTGSKFSRRMVLDNNENAWFGFRDGGMYGYTTNGTLTDQSDDEYVYLNTGENTGALPSNEVTSIAVDQDNEIWIGTDAGFAILYNSSSAFGASFGNYNAQRPKIEFEGNVEYVLGATHITDIVVDGGNRKWMGTANAGIILLSEDGQEIIEQHTIDNSPLISNAILDLELDHQTGELFIVTDKGLVSYRTDGTIEDPTYSNVKVFPNPVRPDYDGPITIQGIRYDSDVKVTDVAGNVIYQTTSNGGTATWDGRTVSGDPVKTGVYLFWTAPNEGKGRKVGKVLVVR